MAADILRCLNYEMGNLSGKTFLRKFTRAAQGNSKTSNLQLEFWVITWLRRVCLIMVVCEFLAFDHCRCNLHWLSSKAHCPTQEAFMVFEFAKLHRMQTVRFKRMWIEEEHPSSKCNVD